MFPGHLLTIQAAPLITSGRNMVVTFPGKVTKRVLSDPSLNQPKSVLFAEKYSFVTFSVTFVTFCVTEVTFLRFQPCPRLPSAKKKTSENSVISAVFLLFSAFPG